MYKKLLTFTFCVIALTMLLSLLPIHGESEIYSNVVRLHVLANSDSESDQALKLKVRDAVLSVTEEIAGECKTKEDAQKKISDNIELIEQTAIFCVREQGYDYDVRVTLSQEEYPTRNYESCCFPAGEYTSLRIMIGEAEGQNWWCVLFPPMCLGAASDGEAYAQVGLSGEQYNLITQTDNTKYKIRFKLLETIENSLNSK